MKKGYKYAVSDEQLIKYKKLSVEEKMKWLDEVNRFTNMFMTDNAKKIREMFRKGEL